MATSAALAAIMLKLSELHIDMALTGVNAQRMTFPDNGNRYHKLLSTL